MDTHSQPPFSSDPESAPKEAQRIPTAPPFVEPESSSPGLSIGDIYYTVFRHKWKIILCSLAGFAAAVAFYLLRPPPYFSEARLFIRYVMENKGVTQAGSDVQMKTIDQRGETILNSEVSILTSLDLARQVAQSVGPEKICNKPENGDHLDAAAAVIQKNLLVEPSRNSSVLGLAFFHPDPVVAQTVLTDIIDRYLKRHMEIHRASGMVGGFLAQETDQLRARLAQTEEELRKARNKAGVINLEDAKKTYAAEIARLRQEILAAQADLAERSALLQETTKQLTGDPGTAEESGSAVAEPPEDQLKQYRDLLNRQEALVKREQELLTYFREDSIRVRDVRTQLAEIQSEKQKLEGNFPQLRRLVLPPVAANPAKAATQVDPVQEAARLTALQVKIKVLNSQLEGVRTEATNMDQMEGTILQLTRQKELEETNYRNYSASLEQSRINEALGEGSVSNITQVQTPSPPQKDMKKSLKVIGGLAVAGVVFGFVWAFGIELYLDRSVRRPIDVEHRLRLPLFISIPKLSKKAAAFALPAGSPGKQSASTALTKWESESALHPFHETLRDRLIGYFESKGLTHKPKLVAVTGIGHGGGVTTTAAGLASSLSETGDGNVLLVDMTQGQGSAQQFYQGKAVCGLEEILDTRDNAQIEQNLYVVGQEPGGERLSRILPHRFNKLVPKLKASNFDYIIFDMPPVSQISITPRLAGFMDMVLLVLESEKNDRELVQRATNLLAESKAHVGAVLNKSKTYVPLRLHQENLGNS